MRIISGFHKGKKLLQPLDKTTRSLRDLVKESIFNLVKHSNYIIKKIENSEILDLFSGSGSFGLECISRGAKNVTFVENYPNVLDILKKNIYLLKEEKKSTVIKDDCFQYFRTEKKFLNTYDLIFMDPPYRETKINNILEDIKKKRILSKNGTIIIHRHKKDNIDIHKEYKILDTRTYGISKVLIINH